MVKYQIAVLLLAEVKVLILLVQRLPNSRRQSFAVFSPYERSSNTSNTWSLLHVATVHRIMAYGIRGITFIATGSGINKLSQLYYRLTQVQ
jgi:hypothetical protein